MEPELEVGNEGWEGREEGKKEKVPLRYRAAHTPCNLGGSDNEQHMLCTSEIPAPCAWAEHSLCTVLQPFLQPHATPGRQLIGPEAGTGRAQPISPSPAS